MFVRIVEDSRFYRIGLYGCTLLRNLLRNGWRSHAKTRKEVFMWYVLQVTSGQEEKMQNLCEVYIDPCILDGCFCPKYEASKKIKGKRKIVLQKLFPGYLFLDTENIEDVHEYLREIPEFKKLLKSGNDFLPITEEEQSFIMEHGNGEHIFEMSTGYMKGDQVLITQGAFAGYEGKLSYVDRHNRYGIMKVEMFGRVTEMKFGLEVISKTEG
jgi:transcription antitermination factor NusG